MSNLFFIDQIILINTIYKSHIHDVKRSFWYLTHIPNHGLWYPRHSFFDLIGYTYSNYARCTFDRKLTSGGCQLLGNRLIKWSSKKESLLACLNTGAKYVVAARCCSQILWIQKQFIDYGLKLTKTLICCENTNAILITSNPLQHSKTIHIQIRHHVIINDV